MLLQVFATELVTFAAVDFVPLAVELSTFAVEFIGSAVEFVMLAPRFIALAIELDTFAMVLPIFWNGTGQFRKILHNYFTGWDKIFRVLLATNYFILPVLAFKYSKPLIFGHQVFSDISTQKLWNL